MYYKNKTKKKKKKKKKKQQQKKKNVHSNIYKISTPNTESFQIKSQIFFIFLLKT